MKDNNLAIIATNVRSQGGINHIKNLVNNYKNFNVFKKIIIWGNDDIKKNISNNSKIIIINKKKRFLIIDIFWRIFLLNNEIIKKNCSTTLSLDSISVTSNKTKLYFFSKSFAFSSKSNI